MEISLENLKNLNKMFERFQPRHFRLLNRLESKALKDKIKNKRDSRIINKRLKKCFDSDSDYLKGVASALYSKLNGSIKDTRFNSANLGLVIANNDVKTNYPIKNLKDFMNYSGIYNSNLFENFGFINRIFLVRIKDSQVLENSIIDYSSIANNLEIYNSNIASKSEIKNNSNIAYNSDIDGSRICSGSIISNSLIAYNSGIKNNSNIARTSIIKDSNVANASYIHSSKIANVAEFNNSVIASSCEIEKSMIANFSEAKNSKICLESEVKKSLIGHALKSNNLSIIKKYDSFFD